MNTDFDLIAILRIAGHLATKGEGASMTEALKRTRYPTVRESFGPQEVRLLLVAHPELLDEWLAYSQDKRTDAGWYVLRDGEIGQIREPTAQRSYSSIEQAVAEFIVRELDFFAASSL